MSNYNNPYAPVITTQSNYGSRYPLASLGNRFAGVMLDGLVSLVAVLPGGAALIIDQVQQGPSSNGQPGTLGMVGIGLILLAVLVLAGLQIYLLVTRSQTIGKFIVKTQIVDFESGQPAGFLKSFVVRSFVNGLIGAIPVAGPFYSIVDVLFIFRADRRCLHDLLASTSVVDISVAD